MLFQLVLQGLTKGFRISFHREAVLVRSTNSIMILAATHWEVVTICIKLFGVKTEGRLQCTGRQAPWTQLTTWDFIVVLLKSFQRREKQLSGELEVCRCILESFLPLDGSINDEIPKEWCSVQYTSVSAVAVRIVNQL